MSSANTRTSECSSFCVGERTGREPTGWRVLETYPADCRLKGRQRHGRSHARVAREAEPQAIVERLRPTSMSSAKKNLEISTFQGSFFLSMPLFLHHLFHISFRSFPRSASSVTALTNNSQNFKSTVCSIDTKIRCRDEAWGSMLKNVAKTSYKYIDKSINYIYTPDCNRCFKNKNKNK